MRENEVLTVTPPDTMSPESSTLMPPATDIPPENTEMHIDIFVLL